MNSLVAGTIVFRQYQSKYSNGRLNQNGIVAVQYMCIGHLILGLSKVLEFRKHYHYLIPFDLIEVFKDLTNKLSKSHVKELRFLLMY